MLLPAGVRRDYGHCGVVTGSRSGFPVRAHPRRAPGFFKGNGGRTVEAMVTLKRKGGGGVVAMGAQTFKVADDGTVTVPEGVADVLLHFTPHGFARAPQAPQQTKGK